MRTQKSIFRWLTGWLLLAALGVGALGGAGLSVRAAPEKQVAIGDVVISEFRTTGPGGGNDEFIELYNRTNNSIDIAGWLIRRSSSNPSSNPSTLYPFPSGTTLSPGQRYMVAGSSYSGSVPGDVTTALGIADDGGIALTLANGTTRIDAVGMSSGSTYLEGTPLAQLPGGSDQSYARINGGCTDTDNNNADFVLQSPSDPQNSTSIPVRCLRVINVTSTTADGIYVSGATIAITVEFSSNVNVTGSPTLLLETGLTDRAATYASGGGSKILTFTYNVQAGDVSGDLNYVASNSLWLNGGTITGAVGDADLTLPDPTAPESLGGNKAIVIDNQQPPSLVSFKRLNPLTSPTNLDTLVFRATFSEPVEDVEVIDFTVSGTTANVTSVSPGLVISSVYDITVSEGDLADLDGTVGLDLSGTLIRDAAGNQLPAGEPSVDEVYILDNTEPTVTVNQATGQADPASGAPVNFTVAFSEPIDVSSFTTDVITQSGSAVVNTWSIIDSGNHMNFTLSATAISANGNIIPSIGAGRVQDPAGNPNDASTSTDNTVQFTDNVPPSVTINQASGQSDPSNGLPIRFDVVFSEPIIASIFTPSDITQKGTATGITWSITDSGDHQNFTLSATSVNGYGTLVPFIDANRVTDLVGNNNTASTGTDNSVEFQAVGALTVVINEVAWAGTQYSSNDEWIELYNPGSQNISLAGWLLKSSDGSPNISLSGTIEAGGYYLLERTEDTTDVESDLLYSGSLSNSGEILRLFAPNGEVVDRANENGGAWPAGILSSQSSMQRSRISADSDFVWVTYDPANDTGTRAKDDGENDINGTPGRANRPINVSPTATPGAGGSSGSGGVSGGVELEPILGISEFLPRPGHDWNNDGKVDVFDEFIEIINAGQIDVDLSAYKVDDEQDLDSAPYTLPDITLEPGERAVFYAAETGILLSDAGDTVRLLRGSTVVDAYTYTVVRYPDQAWCRIPDRLGYWNAPCFPTPGNPNALTGTFPQPPGPSTGYRAPVCLLPDTTPEEFVYAECEAGGDGIWNRLYWDGTGFIEWLLSEETQKWETVLE